MDSILPDFKDKCIKKGLAWTSLLSSIRSQSNGLTYQILTSGARGITGVGGIMGAWAYGMYE